MSADVPKTSGSVDQSGTVADFSNAPLLHPAVVGWRTVSRAALFTPHNSADASASIPTNR